MKFDTTITLAAGETFPYNANQAAQRVLNTLGGNPTKDTATVQVVMNEHGGAGADPPQAVVQAAPLQQPPEEG